MHTILWSKIFAISLFTKLHSNYFHIGTANHCTFELIRPVTSICWTNRTMCVECRRIKNSEWHAKEWRSANMCWYARHLLQQLLWHARNPSAPTYLAWFIQRPALISHRRRDWTDLNFQSNLASGCGGITLMDPQSTWKTASDRGRPRQPGRAAGAVCGLCRRTPGKIDACPVAILNPDCRP